MKRPCRYALVVLLACTAIPRAQAPDIEITTTARSEQPGELVVLAAAIVAPAEAVRVHALGRTLSAVLVGPQTWQSLIGIDIDVRPGRYPVEVEAQDGPRLRRGTTTLVVRPRIFPTRKLSVDPAFVNPPPELEGRIVQEAKQLEALWTDSAPSRLWMAPFVEPVAASASGRFGARSIFNGQPRSRHAGEDFPSPQGTPVLAPNAGRVVLAKDLYFAGNIVVIDHGLGFFSLLEHLSVIDVKEGDRVQTGQRVGLVGATGRVTGPHLHWAVRLNGARVDPLSVLASLGR